MTVLHDLFGLNARINTGMPAIWDDPFFLGMQINPMILRLLPAAEQINNSGGTIETACRLAALVYLGEIRVEFVMYHVTGYHFVERLQQTILAETTDWEEFQDLRLWALVIGAIKASPTDRLLFIEGVKRSLDCLCISTWEEATLIVRSIIWNDEIYGQRCSELGNAVMGS